MQTLQLDQFWGGRSIATLTNDAIIMIDDKAKISFWNNAAEKILGHTADEALGSEMHELVMPEEFHHGYLKGFESFKDSGQGPVMGKTLTLPALQKDGTVIHTEQSFSALKLGNKWQATAIVRDITERKQAEEALQVAQNALRLQATYDDLTGTFNRRAILETLEREIERSRREEKSLCVAMLDLDYFKRINDEYGHLAGDQVLKEATSRLRSRLRVYDALGRYGGERSFLQYYPTVVSMMHRARQKGFLYLLMRNQWIQMKV